MLGVNTALNDCLSTQLCNINQINGIYNPFKVSGIIDTYQTAHNSVVVNPPDKIDLIGTTNYLKIKNV